MGPVEDNVRIHSKDEDERHQNFMLCRRHDHYVEVVPGMHGAQGLCIETDEMARITPNMKKSHLVPTQKLEHLGYILDTKRNRIYATPEIRRKILELQTPTGRMIASLLGLINHAAVAIPILTWRRRPNYHSWVISTE